METVVLNDRKARLIGIPLLSLMIPLVTHSDVFLAGNVNGIFHWLSTCFLNTFLLWEGNRYIFIKSRQFFPQYNQTTQRLVYQTLASIAYTLLTTIVVDYFFCNQLLGWEERAPFLIGFRISLIPTLVVTLIYESVFFFQAWQQNVKKTESLARENVQSQLEALKNQLDPHFLFNSMNTLAALIDDENAPAQKYLDQLSDVYRYVLVSRERSTVTLEEEMAFLDAYIYLNKTRFRENLMVEAQVDEAAYQKQVAPLSLQMLLENAIKHNIISKENPLTIKILQENDYLSIANNLQEKKTFEKSTKVGLQNIINRYRLLTDQQVEIHKSEWNFTVRIPLLP
ncbi:histidine kinase [Runella rosea]|uniref:Histidine kinase n=1 Tax=Runella rosea TaxID=2259595 RepID=A0A344TEV3_9BACT|nr:histidine kinase [Runella rosea]AXE17174.1 histidine kinase [Runella rosea]